jgi:hypothetical protein
VNDAGEGIAGALVKSSFQVMVPGLSVSEEMQSKKENAPDSG